MDKFVKAVIDFFYIPNNVYELSFYSHVEQTLKGQIIFLKEHPELNENINKCFYDVSEVKDVMDILNKIVDIYLPRNWSNLSASYLRLRGLLLN